MDEEDFLTEITSIKKETPGLFLVRMTKPAGFSNLPGQYIRVSLVNEPSYSFFAVSSHPSEKYLELLINPTGGVAKKICHQVVGTELRISLPQGNGFDLKKLENKTVYLITHGTGISSIKPVIEELRKDRSKYGPIRLLYGVRYHDDFPFKENLRDWMGSIELYDIISRDPEDMKLWTGETGYVQDILTKLQPEPENSVALLSGSEKMEHQVFEILREFGFEEDAILRNH